MIDCAQPIIPWDLRVKLHCPVNSNVTQQEGFTLFGLFKKKPQPPERREQFPPVPDWKPDIQQPLKKIIERFAFYTNGTRDFAVFTHGTVAILPPD